MAVIVAGEFHYAITPGCSARHANGGHRRFGAAGHEPHHFQTNDAASDLFG